MWLPKTQSVKTSYELKKKYHQECYYLARSREYVILAFRFSAVPATILCSCSVSLSKSTFFAFHSKFYNKKVRIRVYQCIIGCYMGK